MQNLVTILMDMFVTDKFVLLVVIITWLAEFKQRFAVPNEALSYLRQKFYSFGPRSQIMIKFQISADNCDGGIKPKCNFEMMQFLIKHEDD